MKQFTIRVRISGVKVEKKRGEYRGSYRFFYKVWLGGKLVKGGMYDSTYTNGMTPARWRGILIKRVAMELAINQVF